jgi:DNA-binding LacI/PurR family transcriptional regulator
MATISDVAKRAGVSKGTVSNVFSKKRPISREVSERVLLAAKELNYTPNHVARSLAIKKTMIVGLKMPQSKDAVLSSFEMQMINGVIKECSKHGYRVLLDTLPDSDDVSLLSRDPVDGVIMLNPRKKDPRIEAYNGIGIPLVLVGRPGGMHNDVSFVDNNNMEIVENLADRLIHQGHRHILFLNASSDMTVAMDRKKGLETSFIKNGLSFCNEDVLYYSNAKYCDKTEYGYQATLQTIHKKPYTAVIADTDRVAIGVLRAAREMNIDLPGQLSVIALHNDAMLAQELSPKLTCVELFPEVLGAEAARILFEKMNNTSTLKHLIIPAKLVIRESCSL